MQKGRSSLPVRWAEYYTRHPAIEGLVKAIPWGIGGAAHGFILELAKHVPLPDDLNTVAKYLAAAELLDKELDNDLLRQFRSFRQDHSEDQLDVYGALLRNKMTQHSVTLEKLSQFLNDTAVTAIRNSGPLQPSLNIKCGPMVGDRFSYVEFQANDQTLLSLNDAPLLWDCNGLTKDYEVRNGVARSDFPCPVHDGLHGAELNRRFNGDHVSIEHDGVRVLWRNHPNLWPPSIDTMNMADDIRQSGLLNEPIRTVLDLGCGTGFLGIWFAKSNPEVRAVFFADWLVGPLAYSAINASENLPDEYKKRGYLLGLNTQWENLGIAPPRTFDLIVCNPPYLPDLGVPEILKESTVMGTVLLNHVLSIAPNKSKRVVVSFSDIVIEETMKHASEVGVRLLPLLRDVEHEVPYRVRPSLENRSHIDKMVSQGRLKEHPDRAHLFWHKVATYEVVKA
ncbi:MAG: methyltransferase [Alphaproteobacteria bacterium]